MRYMATGRALRQALSCSNTRETNQQLIRTLRCQYLQASTAALVGITDCYRHGMVVTDEDVWRPDERIGPLIRFLEEMVTWASTENGNG